MFAGSYLGSVMVVVSCKNLPQLKEILLFMRDMNEPVLVIQTALFTHVS